MFVALNRLTSALELANQGCWHTASARVLRVGLMEPSGLHLQHCFLQVCFVAIVIKHTLTLIVFSRYKILICLL